jgi:hypothetical protein
MADEWNPETSVSNDLLDRLPPEVLETFTPEQRAALWGAARPSTWRYHPIDIRISLPFLGMRWFLTVVSGVERRSPNRRRRDSRTHPFLTISNIIFLAVMFFAAVALGSVLTDLLHWLTEQFSLTVPSATGVVAPR